MEEPMRERILCGEKSLMGAYKNIKDRGRKKGRAKRGFSTWALPSEITLLPFLLDL